jgi:hypothetical protein
MQAEAAHVALSPLPTTLGACELCTAEPAELSTALVVRHARGGTVQLAICGRCTLALSRVAAATGGQAHFAIAEGLRPVPARGTDARPRAPDRWALVHVEVIHEFAELLRAADGTAFVGRVYGGERRDGSWVGWLEFVAAGSGAVLRTERETTQSNREHLVYWATGLEPRYLEGALARAASVEVASQAPALAP